MLVLVVEDDPAIGDLLQMVLADAGHDALIAAHGAVALELLQQHRPRLILLDLWMPVMNGLEFAQRYRESFREPVPLVVMSAGQQNRNYLQAIAPDATLKKPFELEELLAVLDRFAMPDPA